MKKLLTLLLVLTSVVVTVQAQRGRGGRNLPTHEKEDFYKTEEARRIGDQVLLYQRVTGGWPKNINMSRPLTDEERVQVLRDKERRDDSTTDNGATNMQMLYLAKLYQATQVERYKEGVLKAVEYLLSGQYENGGWPQFWPEMHGYQMHITYNDDAMVNTMNLLRAVAQQKDPYQGLADEALRQRCMKAFDKGVECILKTQMHNKEGRLTVWCQQHYRDNYEPAPARAYELPSYCSMESASITKLLMSLPNPDERVKQAVHAAMAWFDKYKLTGLRIQRTGPWASMDGDTKLVEDADAEPIWGRYYDLKYCEPYVCDRDGLPRRRLEDIGHERRNGYAWFGSRPAELYPTYDKWADRYDPQHKVTVSLKTKGANENGLIDMFRQPQKDLNDFDAVVKAGERIQDAIEKAPLKPVRPFKIFIRKGLYQQKVIIDRPNIVLVGEDRDSTCIVLAETEDTRIVKEYHGQPVHHGVVVLQEGADDCVISGLTIYNNYGTVVEPGNTKHQMAVYGRGTRTIVINSNIWADGNDALSLWAREGGMYYHADLYLRCPGVDFLCPRGWCYATRCRLYGDGRALIWHDGRNNADQKLVITNSQFDAKRPTPLGRYHHDSQFYIVNCKLSENILDQNIEHAYKGRTAEEMAKEGKKLDPCPWGQRTYYYGNRREGGHSGWLKDNLKTAPGSPEFHMITALWTFDGKWDPEQYIRELWNVLAY
ncbi:MAG: pectate lyase [Prevotella sp.]|jgi:PelA/Pel-15E family pectate lyase|nr:pectate lyase [Prevotella sp.]MBQ5494597.1 pectate lyase [Prevotella sp.]